MKENGKADSDMALVKCNGKTVQLMKDTGVSEEHLGKEPLLILKVKSTLVNGEMIKLMEKVLIHIRMVRNMKATGFKTCNMASVRNVGLIARCLSAIIEMARRTALVDIFGLMAHLMKVSGKKMR